MKRRIAYALVGLVLVAMMIGAGLFSIVTTPQGTAAAVAFVRWLLPSDRVSVARIDGDPTRGLTLHDLTVKTASVTVHVDTSMVRVRPSALWRRTLEIPSLHAVGVHITLTQSDAPPLSSLPPLPKLPFAWILPEIQIDDVDVTDVSGARQALVRLQGALHMARGGDLMMDVVRIQHALGHLEFDGRWRTGDPARVDARVAWDVSHGSAHNVTGSGTLTAHGGSLIVVQTLSAPMRASVTANLALPVGHAPWSVEVAVAEPQQLPDALALPFVARFAGQLRVTGAENKAKGMADLSLETQGYGVWHLNADAHTSDWKRVEIDSADAKGRDPSGTAVHLSGAVALDRGAFEHADLEITWRDLVWPLTGTPDYHSPSGALSLQGGPTDYAYRIDATAQAPRLPVAQLEATGRGSPQDLQLDAFKTTFSDGVLEGRGALEWRGAMPAWTFDARAQQFNPRWVAPDWPGQLTFALRSAGTVSDFVLDVTDLQGELRGRSIRGQASVRRAGAELEVRSAELTAGRSRLTVAGTVAERGKLDWSFDSPDLADLWPTAAGELRGTGSLAGTLDMPLLRGEFDGKSLQLAGVCADDVKASWDLAPTTPRDQNLRVSAEGVYVGDHRLDRLTGTIQGPLHGHTIEIGAAAGDASLTLALRGSLDDWQRWAGRLERGEWRGTADQGFRLRSPGELRVDRKAITIGPQCWDGAGSICVHGTATPHGPWDARIELTDLVPTILADWPLGPLTGEAAVNGNDRVLHTLTADLRVPAGRWTPATKGAPELVYDGLRLQARTEAAGAIDAPERVRLRAELHGALTAPSPVPLEATFALDDGPWPFDELVTRTLSGSLAARIDDLAPFAEMTDEVAGVQGHANIDLHLQGSLRAPVIGGHAILEVPRVQITRLGLALEDGRFELHSADTDTIAFTGAWRAGPGHAELKGRLQPAADSWRAELTLNSERLQIVDLPEATALATAQLTALVEPTQASLQGQITIPEGNFKVRETASATRRSADVVVHEDAAGPRRDYGLSSNIGLELGDDVKFDAQGLTGKLSGALQLRDKPGRPTYATGSLAINDGRYEAYGQSLELKKSYLRYADQPVDDPSVDARAERVVGSVTAGLRVTGRLRDPHTAFYSEPALADRDILSYLLLGQPLNAASSGDASALMGMAAKLGISQGSFLLRGIAQAFGLSELSVSEGTGDDGAGLSLGRFLSPRLYMGYGYGFVNHANAFRLRYRLGERWHVEAETGSESGADLLYSIER